MLDWYFVVTMSGMIIASSSWQKSLGKESGSRQSIGVSDIAN